MDFSCVLQWLSNNWISLLILAGTVTIVVLTVRILSPTFTLLEWVGTLRNDVLNIYGEIHVNTPTPHKGKCDGTLKVGKTTLKLPARDIVLMTNGVYQPSFDIPYQSGISSVGTLRLRVIFGNHRPKKLKPVKLSIVYKPNLPMPQLENRNPLGHRKDDSP